MSDTAQGGPAATTASEQAFAHPLIFAFGDGAADGDRQMKDLLGGKGANLAEMSRLGLPVPPGFTITTEVCTFFNKAGGGYPDELSGLVGEAMAKLESSLGKRFGDPQDPLLVSVRSGARVSMPGMMDTILNLGLNEETVRGLAERSGNTRFAWDAYRRFVQMYGEVVLGVGEGHERSPYTLALDALKEEKGAAQDTQLTAKDLLELTRRFKALTKEHTGEEFPEDPMQQLWGAISAVFRSWENERAVTYRQMNGFSHDWGTAVNVVAMVFGNLGDDSGTGVAFTRDPSTGERRFYGEYLLNAQGEDVVAGLRTPVPIAGLEAALPDAWKELLRIQETLEDHFGDMQDLEFTIQEGKLYMLQCRSGKRTGFAALRIASDMVDEGRIDSSEAVLRVPPDAIDQVLQPIFDERELHEARDAGRFLCRGLNAGPGAATGRIAFSSQRAQEIAQSGEAVILVRIETSPEDIKGMQASGGILTARGGMTSHAALVARQMGKVCIAGAEDLVIDYGHARLDVAGKTLREGDWLSIDGTIGEVFEGKISTVPSIVHTAIFDEGERGEAARASALYQSFQRVLGWADEHRRMKVRTNADQPDQCEVAVKLGAEGIGLCRTEHMFFGEKKIGAVRAMIMAEDEAARERALARLLPLQRADFEGVFRAMAGRPVTIRTLDPPLHEFLPHGAEATVQLAAELGVTIDTIEKKVEQLSEQNPMLGHRGCRLGISHPEITRMQARAIFEAACTVKAEGGPFPLPEIMIPLVCTARELRQQAKVIRDTAAEVFEEMACNIPYQIGTMIELPRAALRAGTIANEADFFSFGTNDLTQTTFGISRDDGGSFLPHYHELGILEGNPFASIDRRGVGRLMRCATEEGRETRPDIKLGICGEHGGDPNSIEFCEELGLSYVSCSPYRVPVARLAAAQAALKQKHQAKP